MIFWVWQNQGAVVNNLAMVRSRAAAAKVSLEMLRREQPEAFEVALNTVLLAKAREGLLPVMVEGGDPSYFARLN